MPRSKPARTVALLLATLTVVTAGTVLALVLHILRTEKNGEQARWKEAAQQRLEAGARRVREAWQEREAAVLQLRDLPPAEAFAAVVRDGLADSVIFPANGQPGYPSLTERGPFDDAGLPPPAEEALAALRAKIAAQDWSGAGRISAEFFAANRGIKGTGGRDLALGSDLMLLSALRRARQEVPSWLPQRMTEELKNYRVPTVPSPQRRMLMEELAGGEAAAVFPTYLPECFAQNVLSEIKTPLLEVIPVGDSGVKLLFTQPRLLAILSGAPGDEGVTIDSPWSGTPYPIETPLHPSLPGWRAVTSASESDRRSNIIPVMTGGGAATLLLGILSILTWRQMQRQLRRAQLQEDLAATVSHELRTPVASMRVLAESLLEEDQPEPQKTREYLQLIAGENVRLSRLIENFLTLARLERRSPSKAERVSVVEIVDRVTAAAGANAARLQFAGPPPEGHVRIEPASLETALMNLLDNACKYSPAEAPVEWSAAVAGAEVVFTVQDRGPGLTPGQIARLWEPFERGDTAQPGCGLGLTIVKRIAGQAGGSVSAAAADGGGCRFRLLLPLAEKAPA